MSSTPAFPVFKDGSPLHAKSLDDLGDYVFETQRTWLTTAQPGLLPWDVDDPPSNIVNGDLIRRLHVRTRPGWIVRVEKVALPTEDPAYLLARFAARTSAQPVLEWRPVNNGDAAVEQIAKFNAGKLMWLAAPICLASLGTQWQRCTRLVNSIPGAVDTLFSSPSASSGTLQSLDALVDALAELSAILKCALATPHELLRQIDRTARFMRVVLIEHFCSEHPHEFPKGMRLSTAADLLAHQVEGSELVRSLINRFAPPMLAPAKSASDKEATPTDLETALSNLDSYLRPEGLFFQGLSYSHRISGPQRVIAPADVADDVPVWQFTLPIAQNVEERRILKIHETLANLIGYRWGTGGNFAVIPGAFNRRPPWLEWSLSRQAGTNILQLRCSENKHGVQYSELMRLD